MSRISSVQPKPSTISPDCPLEDATLDVEEVFADLPKKQSEAIESNLKAIKRTNETHLLG